MLQFVRVSNSGALYKSSERDTQARSEGVGSFQTGTDRWLKWAPTQTPWSGQRLINDIL
jgi:hypothetical protein